MGKLVDEVQLFYHQAFLSSPATSDKVKSGGLGIHMDYGYIIKKKNQKKKKKKKKKKKNLEIRLS